MLRLLLFLFAALICFGGIYLIINRAELIHTISDVEITHTSIIETTYRIHLYAQKHSKIPDSLSDLPKREGYINRTSDGWGISLNYNVDESVISLSSLGKDGVFGGTGDNEDIVKRYRYIDDEGNFIGNNEYWMEDAEI